MKISKLPYTVNFEKYGTGWIMIDTSGDILFASAKPAFKSGSWVVLDEQDAEIRKIGSLNKLSKSVEFTAEQASHFMWFATSSLTLADILERVDRIVEEYPDPRIKFNYWFEHCYKDADSALGDQIYECYQHIINTESIQNPAEDYQVDRKIAGALRLTYNWTEQQAREFSALSLTRFMQECDYKRNISHIPEDFNEVIACAATKFEIVGSEEILVLPMVRHMDPLTWPILELFKKAGVELKQIEQGFVTNKQQFLNRSQAMIVAKAHNQIRRGIGYDSELLFSEILY